jgi:hypothetical protein
MTKAVRVGLGNLAPESVMAKERAQCGGGHGAAAPAAFERDKQGGGVGQRSLEVEILLEDLKSIGG